MPSLLSLVSIVGLFASSVLSFNSSDMCPAEWTNASLVPYTNVSSTGFLVPPPPPPPPPDPKPSSPHFRFMPFRPNSDGRRQTREEFIHPLLPEGTLRLPDGQRAAVLPGIFLPQLAADLFAPLAIGLGLTLIHLIGIPVTNLSVNPARSTGPALFVGGWAIQQLWLFWLAPIVGAALAGIIYPIVSGEKKG